jgi:aminopeptidase N
MTRNILLLITSVLFCHTAGAAALSGTMAKRAASRGDSIDVLHYDLHLSIRNLSSKSISGYAVLDIEATKANVSTIALDLLKLNVTRVLVDSQNVTYSQNDSVLTVRLNSNLPVSGNIKLHVEYNGQPVTDASWGGFYFSGNYAFNMGVGFASDPHNFGRCWFPCIDNFTDRATYAFHITTDAGFVAVCNGLKQADMSNPDGSTTWNWHLAQPIPTYLASVAVGKYAFVSYDFPGENRTYPVILAVEPKDTPKVKASLSDLDAAFAHFQQKFGPYMFDRVGYVGVPFNAGAMEHATSIAYPLYAIDGTKNYETLFAHELSHMWWGDQATCRTAEDMWLNEGWASFCEALFLEFMYGKQAYLRDIREKSVEVLKNAPANDRGMLPVSGIPHSATYGTHVYKKGALMVHTLRTIMGDNAFFDACKSYLAKYTFKDVSTYDLRDEFQRFTTVDLTAFFAKWILSAGHSDIVVSRIAKTPGNASTAIHIEFAELSRLSPGTTPSLPFTFRYFTNTGSGVRTLVMNNGSATLDLVLSGEDTVTGWLINDDNMVQLGSTIHSAAISSTGNISLADALLSVIVQVAGNTGDSIHVTHHWTAPLEGNIRQSGIRISAERYWSVTGKPSSGIAAFFNYDGREGNYLDSDLIDQTEDSLVLLYRPVGQDWQLHTDHTFQPGNSKTDKTGRFWVNHLQRGDYAFGMRDSRVTGVNEPKQGKVPGFQLIPNPTANSGTVTLQFSRSMNVSRIYITGKDGREVRSWLINRELVSHEIDTSFLPEGSYMVVAETAAGIVSRQLLKH